MPLTGVYRFASGIEVILAHDPALNRLSIEFPNGDVYGLVPTGLQSFIHPETAVTVDFDGTQRVTVYGETATRMEE